MKFIFIFFFSIFIFCYLQSKSVYALGNVDWILLKENEKGKEWLDLGSIKSLNDKEISVLTKFHEKPKDIKDKGKTSLYVMRINCLKKEFKDISINGIHNFNSEWQDSNNDELIDVVINKSCLEGGF